MFNRCLYVIYKSLLGTKIKKKNTIFKIGMVRINFKILKITLLYNRSTPSTRNRNHKPENFTFFATKFHYFDKYVKYSSVTVFYCNVLKIKLNHNTK